MRVRPLIYPFSLVILVFTVGSGLFAACGDPSVQTQAGEDSGKAGLESKSSKPVQNGPQSTSLKINGTQSAPAQDTPGLRHSTGDEGHAVRLKAQDSSGQSQHTGIAGCTKSDYSTDQGSKDSAQDAEANRANAACDQ